MNKRIFSIIITILMLFRLGYLKETNEDAESVEKESNRNIAAVILGKNPWWYDLSQKISKVHDFITVAAHHPNFGGLQLLNPQTIWEGLHEKGVHYFTGPIGAVFGVAKPEKDYPFDYRNVGRYES